MDSRKFHIDGTQAVTVENYHLLIFCLLLLISHGEKLDKHSIGLLHEDFIKSLFNTRGQSESENESYETIYRFMQETLTYIISACHRKRLNMFMNE